MSKNQRFANVIQGELTVKHIFIVNPEAGPTSPLEDIKRKLESIGKLEESEIYVTKSPQDATDFVSSRLKEESDEILRFYACGGDGTISEVASGAVGYDNAEISCYPTGSGNDYVKCFGGKPYFSDLEALMNSEAEPVDLMSVCGRYSINVCNVGFEAAVAEAMGRVRRKKILGGKNAYTTGIIKALFTNMKNKCTVIADGEVINPRGTMLLCTIANGQYVGGAYRCAPRSLYNDGLLDVCFVKPVTIFTFLKLISKYKEGLHLDDPKFQKYIVYRRATKIEVHARKNASICIDGEILNASDYTIEVIPNAIKFAHPANILSKV